MKNLIIIWSEPLDDLRGGIHRTINILLKYLPEKGYNVEYFFTLDHYNSFFSKNGNLHLSQDQFKAFLEEHQCNIILGQEAIWDSELTRLIKSYNLPNIRLINQYHSTLEYFNKKLSWNYLYYKWITDKNPKNRLNVLIRAISYPLWKYNVRKKQNKIYRYNYYNSDISVFLSEYEKPIMGKITQDPSLNKCAVIHNPLSWEKITNDDILRRKKKEVLIVSRIYNCEKRIDLALKVWKRIEKDGRFDGWSLRILGDGIDKEYLMKYAESLKLKRVIWESSRDPIEYYEKASIFLMTSVAEGWGLTLTESLQTGVIPLAFDSYSAVKDIITDGYNGFAVKPLHVGVMVDRLKRLMLDERLRNTMALNCLESAQRFQINKIIEKWDNLLKQ